MIETHLCPVGNSYGGSLFNGHSMAQFAPTPTNKHALFVHANLLKYKQTSGTIFQKLQRYNGLDRFKAKGQYDGSCRFLPVDGLNPVLEDFSLYAPGFEELYRKFKNNI